MPHLLENAHALLNRAMNLVKEDVKHLNPNQTPVLTMNQLPMLRWPGEWLNGSEWPGAITTAGTVLQNLL